MFETTNVMMGNDQIARNVVEMMNGLRELELIDILDMLLLQSTAALTLPLVPVQTLPHQYKLFGPHMYS